MPGAPWPRCGQDLLGQRHEPAHAPEEADHRPYRPPPGAHPRPSARRSSRPPAGAARLLRRSAASAAVGKGQRLIGRKQPGAACPFARPACTAVCAMRAAEPKATTTSSASSVQLLVIARPRRRGWPPPSPGSARSWLSSASAAQMQRGDHAARAARGPGQLPAAVAVAPGQRIGGISTGSIICPIVPSAAMITMVRYCSARSKAP